MKKVAFFLLIGIAFLQVGFADVSNDLDTRFGTNSVHEPGFFQNFARDWGRGLTNIVSSPLEIPVTIARYDREDRNPPVIKHVAGLTDGIVRTAMRAGSGLWDLLVSVLPGDQEGAPVHSETLFSKT